MKRVVSLVPSLTLTMFDLGLGDQVVGITRYCEEPADKVCDLAQVGGTKNPKLDRIVELRPDLVLVNSEENRAADIRWLRDRFPVHESMPRTVAESAEMVRSLGEALGSEAAASAMALEIEDELRRAGEERPAAPPVGVFYAIWKKPWMSINKGTYIHDVLTVAGAANVCAERDERYPSLEDEELATVAARLVLLPSEPFPFTEVHRTELVDAQTFGAAEVRLVDGRDYCWHGSRTATGLRRARELLAEFRSRS